MAWLGEKVFGNFKTPVVDRLKEKHRDKHDDREGNDSNHLAALRKCPCIVTLKMPAGEVHHLKSLGAGKERGVGRRASDRWGVPLSRIPHESLEAVGSRNELKWFAEHRLGDVHEIAAALWAVRPSDGSAKAIKMATEAMTRIIVAHHSLAKRSKKA
jgi:hypothetical protein